MMVALRAKLSQEEIAWMQEAVHAVMQGDASTHIAVFNLDLLFSDPGCESTAFSEAVQAVQNAAKAVMLGCIRIQGKL